MTFLLWDDVISQSQEITLICVWNNETKFITVKDESILESLT